MPIIERLESLEILDSRGRPTLQTRCMLQTGGCGQAQVPSGASTGTSEALELRDGDPLRHGGFGCLNAVANVTGEIQEALKGLSFSNQESLDDFLVRLDGTPNKSRLGANAILSVSLAFARAHAQQLGQPLYRHFADLAAEPLRQLPRLSVNLFSGGKHAGGQVAIQDVLLVPLRAPSIAESLAMICAVVRAAGRLCETKYRARALVADEGGLAPAFPSAETMIADAVQAIRDAGFDPGKDCALAIDVASTHFHHDQRYHLDGEALNASEMINRLEHWCGRFPIVSLEDPLAEEDWDNWPALVARLGSRVTILGDDLLCTHPRRVERAIARHAASALLLKVNQVGTLTEANRSRVLARAAKWQVTISARSGETEDTWLADLAFGWGADFIKVGSITRSERLAKYNRLLEIESDLRPSCLKALSTHPR